MFNIWIIFIVGIYESCRVNELMQLLNNTNKDSQVKMYEQRLPQDVPDCLTEGRFFLWPIRMIYQKFY